MSASNTVKAMGGATGLCAVKLLHTTAKSLYQGHGLPLRSKSYWANLLAVAGGVWATYKLHEKDTQKAAARRARRVAEPTVVPAEHKDAPARDGLPAAQERKAEPAPGAAPLQAQVVAEIQEAINAGRFPLHEAVAITNVPEIVRLLQHPGIRAQINQPDAQGYTPLYRAIKYGRTDLVKLLLETENTAIDINKSIGSETPLEQASYLQRGGRTAIMQLLLADARIDQAEAVRFIRLGTIVGKDSDYALLAQLPRRCIGMQDADGNTILHLLVDRNDDDQRTLTLLHDLVAKSGDVINQKNSKGQTALHRAVGFLNILVMKELLAHQEIEVNIQDTQGNTPLHLMSSYRDIEQIKGALNLLAARGMNPYIANNQGQTAIHLARKQEVLELLLALPGYDTVAQRSLNVRDSEGETALLYFSKHGYVEEVKLLLRYGADPLIANNAGETIASVIAGFEARPFKSDSERAMIAAYAPYRRR